MPVINIANSKKTTEQYIKDIVYDPRLSWEEMFLGWSRTFSNHKSFLDALFTLIKSVKDQIEKQAKSQGMTIPEFFEDEDSFFNFLDKNKKVQEKSGDY